MLVGRTLKRSAVVVANSTWLLDRARSLYRLLPIEKTTVIPNGVTAPVNTKCVGRPFPDKYILAVGKLRYIKGFDILINAFSLLRSGYHDVNLVIIGDGPKRLELEQLIVDIGEKCSIFLVGECTHAEVLRYMECCEFLVVPSRQEAFGLVALEAMSMGKAVIASDVGGLPEIVQHNMTGRVLQKLEPKCVCSEMEELLVNPHKRKVLGQNAQYLVSEHYLCATMIDKYESLFQSLSS